MRRMIPTAMAALLALSATPALAQDEDPSAEPVEPQRAEVAELGVSVEFPGEWTVREVEGQRVSAITTADGQPIMETTALMASGDSGTWCDLDAYLELDAPLEEHAYAYVSYLQRSESADVAMVVVETEIPAGPAYRIELFDQGTGRMRAMYLFDGPAGEDGTFNRFLFTCAAHDVEEPFWEAIAESAEVFEPAPADEPEASAQPAEGEAATEAEPAEEE